MKFTLKKRRVVIDLPIRELRPSASGKTLLMASTGGVRKTDKAFEGRTVCVNANVFCYPDAEIDEAKSNERGKKNRPKNHAGDNR